MSQCPCIWRYKFCTLKQRSKWALYNWSTFVNYHFSHVFNGYFDSYLFQFLTIANIERVVNGQQQCNKKGYQIIFEVLQNWLDSEFYHFCCENGLRQPLLIIVFNFNQKWLNIVSVNNNDNILDFHWNKSGSRWVFHNWTFFVN